MFFIYEKEIWIALACLWSTCASDMYTGHANCCTPHCLMTPVMILPKIGLPTPPPHYLDSRLEISYLHPIDHLSGQWFTSSLPIHPSNSSPVHVFVITFAQHQVCPCLQRLCDSQLYFQLTVHLMVHLYPPTQHYGGLSVGSVGVNLCNQGVLSQAMLPSHSKHIWSYVTNRVYYIWGLFAFSDFFLDT